MDDSPAFDGVVDRQPTSATVSVPDLVGMSSQAARRTARLSELSVDLQERPAAEAFRSRVLWQEPEPGTDVRPGTLITLAVGGRPGVTVPDLRGVDEQESLAVLRAAGLFPARRSVRRSSAVAQGQVIRTRPRAGTEVPTGTRIAYVVAAAPRPSRSAMRRDARRSRGVPDVGFFSLPEDR